MYHADSDPARMQKKLLHFAAIVESARYRIGSTAKLDWSILCHSTTRLA